MVLTKRPYSDNSQVALASAMEIFCWFFIRPNMLTSFASSTLLRTASCLQAIEQQHTDHPLVLEVLEKYSALINKTVLFCWVPSHVGIRGNELADAAAKAALNETLTIMTLPYSDFKPLVKRFIRGKWSDFWATQINNKLHSVQPHWDVDHCQIEIVAENSLFSADYD